MTTTEIRILDKSYALNRLIDLCAKVEKGEIKKRDVAEDIRYYAAHYVYAHKYTPEINRCPKCKSRNLDYMGVWKCKSCEFTW